MNMLDTIRIGAQETIAAEHETAAPDYHATRDMPYCRWSGVHRFDLHAYEGENTIEACMDCGKQRTYPTALNSAHCIKDGAA